jgi:glycosyltransferase involved in cell wall biosynthesis
MEQAVGRSRKSYRVDNPVAGPSDDREKDGGSSRITLSIVIPARNEADALTQLIDELTAAFRPLRNDRGRPRTLLEDFEILIVDDGSTDQTWAILQALRRHCPELHPLRLRQSGGQSAAMFAGFRAARGTWVALLDADLQNPPSELARLWELLPGSDAVLGWRERRRDSRVRRATGAMANRVRRWILRDPIKDAGCSVRIFRREMALRLPPFHGSHRFLGALLLREGCRIVQAPVAHRPRPYGRSHYHIWNRSINVLVDLLGVVWLMHRSIRYQVVTGRLERPRGLAPRGRAQQPAEVPSTIGGSSP